MNQNLNFMIVINLAFDNKPLFEKRVFTLDERLHWKKTTAIKLREIVQQSTVLQSYQEISLS